MEVDERQESIESEEPREEEQQMDEQQPEELEQHEEQSTAAKVRTYHGKPLAALERFGHQKNNLRAIHNWIHQQINHQCRVDPDKLF